MDLKNIQAQLESARYEIDQLKIGKKVASSRARSALMKIKKEFDLIRKEVLTHSKGLPVKPKKVKPAVVLPEKSVEDLPK